MPTWSKKSVNSGRFLCDTDCRKNGKSIAVIGSGVAGLAATWALNEYSNHTVTLFEANDYVGGHTHTVEYQKGENVTPVDTGFIVNPLR